MQTSDEVCNHNDNVQNQSDSFIRRVDMFTEVKVKILMNENDQARGIEMNNSELNGKLDDPGYWPSIISNDIIPVIITLRPIQINNYDFPENDENPARRFTEKYYYRLMPNGEKVNLRGLFTLKDTIVCIVFAVTIMLKILILFLMAVKIGKICQQV